MNPHADSRSGKTYPFKSIEASWLRRWRDADAFRAQPWADRPKFYCIECPPYPNNKLHLGHVRSYTMGDAIARYRRLRGYNVLYTQGFDAFGLPNDIAARKRGCHPVEWVDRCIEMISRQFDRLGLSYDRSRLVGYHQEGYYRWTQWLFLKLLEEGLVYRGRARVNWCETCKTTLADDQLQSGRCWRCDQPTERRLMTQWFIRTTAFADEMYRNLESMPGWSERVRKIQANWIGPVEGTDVRFVIEGAPALSVTVFTSTPEIACGIGFILLAPEHPLLRTFERCGMLGAGEIEQIEALRARMQQARSNITRGKKGRQRPEGVVLTPRAIHPVTGAVVPLVVANTVDPDFATGASGGVAAHSRQDRPLAQQLDLPSPRVLAPPGEGPDSAGDAFTYDDSWVLVHSGELDGWTVAEARERLGAELARRDAGGPAVHYHLRDWQISRQRYWGAPIPVIDCSACGTVPVPDEDLPVRLPEDVDLSVVGNPLEYHSGFVSAPCPRCARVGRRETDTLDVFVSTLWFYYRYAAGDTTLHPFTADEADYWMPGDVYVGGVELATTAYFHDRFLTHALHRMGWIDYDEPARELLAHEMVMRDGRKMSKSLGNTVDPDDIIDEFGADSLRLAILFLASPDRRLEWSDDAVRGCHNFLAELWELGSELAAGGGAGADDEGALQPSPEDLGTLPRAVRGFLFDLHQLTADVTRAYEGHKFNVAVQTLMRLRRLLQQLLGGLEADPGGAGRAVVRAGFSRLVRMLAPVAPHVCEELWAMLGGTGFVMAARWPECDRELLARRERTVLLQIDGNQCASIEVPPDAGEDEVRERGLRHLLAQAGNGVPELDPGRVVETFYFRKKRLDILNLVTRGGRG